MWGAGIFIAEARDVEVYGNTVEGNAGGITAVQQNRIGDQCGIGLNNEVANLFVHDNTIVQATGLAAGLRLYNQSNQAYYTSKNNRWTNNDYSLGNAANGLHFYWVNAKIKWGVWQAAGQE